MKYFINTLFLAFSFFSIAASTDYLPTPTAELVKHTFYTLSYNESNEQAEWVYYVLTDSMVMNSGEERTNKFKIDKLVRTGSAKTSDYTKSGYDRGHLCPAGDMGFNPVAMEESFFMSNISPQTPEFNRGIWKELETKVREWAKTKHRVFVATGPVFRDIKGKIGEEGVTVPGYFYKVIYDESSRPEMIAFLLPNAGSNRPLSDFAVSPDEVEAQTGIDFFSQLPDDVENSLEGRVELAGWFDGYTSAPAQPIATVNSMSNDEPVKRQSDLLFYGILIGVLLLVILFVFIKGKRKR